MLILRLLFSFFVFLPVRADFVPCQCAEISCGPCEMDTGVKFYTENCGIDSKQTKSCKKPNCEKVSSYQVCMARQGLAPEKSNIASTADGTAEISAETTNDARAPASQTPPTKGNSIGKMVLVSGSVDIERLGEATKTSPGHPVYQSDVIVTGANGKAKIVFVDTNELMVTPNSRITLVTVYNEPEKKERSTLLNLMYGTVRSKVRQKYDSQGKNTYQIQTRTAVAGVRGTEFVTSFKTDEKVWKTEIQTIEGKVQLDGNKKAKAEVSAGQSVAFVVHKPGSDLPTDIQSVVDKGHLEKPHHLKKEEIEKINKETLFEESQFSQNEREPSLADVAAAEHVCDAPRANLNQCSWTCENNSSTDKTIDKKCRTDLPNVQCVRRICRANGRWTEPKRLPASQTDFCDGQSVRVGSCGDYW